MSEEKVMIPLTKGKKNAVIIGCVCLMFSVTVFGVGFFVIQGPILAEMHASQYYSLLTIFASLGLAIMTPIGGKIGDLFGRRNIVVISGIICAACGIGMSLVHSILPFAIFRLLLGAAQGAFTAAPYILMREINESKDVPKAMGYLASAIAVGSFGGGILLGGLADAGFLRFALMVPAIPLLIGVVLIGTSLPNKKKDKVEVDFSGIVCLAVLLSGFCLAMNYGPLIGWGNLKVLAGFAVTVVAGIIFVKMENKAAEPIVPMYLFKNRKFTTLLAVGFVCYFYQTAMSAYVPLAVQDVMGVSAAAAGSLQLPRTILTMVLPTIAGVWIGKKAANNWKAMAIATGLAALPFIPLGFTTASTPFIVYLICIGITGIAESFRSVSVTPVAQSVLPQKDLGVGTALVTFVNSLSTLFAAAINGVVYGMSANNVQAGVNNIFRITVIISMAGFFLVIFVVRKQLSGNEKAK